MTNILLKNRNELHVCEGKPVNNSKTSYEYSHNLNRSM